MSTATSTRPAPLAGAALLVLAAVASLPILFLVSLSLRSNDDVLNGGFLPSSVTWDSWPRVFGTIPLGQMLANSWAVAIGSALLTVTIAVPAAYYCARARRSGERLSTVLLASYCAPPVVAVLPLYYLLSAVGLLNTVLGLVLVNGIGLVPVAVWLLDGFVRRVPVELEEAAWLDGLTVTAGLRRIVLPLISPGVVAVALVSMFLAYNEFLFAVSFSQAASSQPLTVGLALFQGDRTVQFGQQAVASLVAIAPMYAVAVIGQRWLVAGLSAGHGR